MENYVILMPNGEYVESVDDNLVFTTNNKKDANIFKLKDAADHAAIMVQGKVVEVCWPARKKLFTPFKKLWH